MKRLSRNLVSRSAIVADDLLCKHLGKHVKRRLKIHTSSAHVLLQQQKENLDYELPQVKVPDIARDELLTFCGMETDFPCLTRNKVTGPEPQYGNIISGYQTYDRGQHFELKYNDAILPDLTVAYETWGELNADKSNAVIIHAGLSASSHAKSAMRTIQILAGGRSL